MLVCGWYIFISEIRANMNAVSQLLRLVTMWCTFSRWAHHALCNVWWRDLNGVIHRWLSRGRREINLVAGQSDVRKNCGGRNAAVPNWAELCAALSLLVFLAGLRTNTMATSTVRYLHCYPAWWPGQLNLLTTFYSSKTFLIDYLSNI